jgi:hypothetical protein
MRVTLIIDLPDDTGEEHLNRLQTRLSALGCLHWHRQRNTTRKKQNVERQALLFTYGIWAQTINLRSHLEHVSEYRAALAGQNHHFAGNLFELNYVNTSQFQARSCTGNVSVAGASELAPRYHYRAKSLLNTQALEPLIYMPGYTSLLEHARHLVPIDRVQFQAGQTAQMQHNEAAASYSEASEYTRNSLKETE